MKQQKYDVRGMKCPDMTEFEDEAQFSSCGFVRDDDNPQTLYLTFAQDKESRHVYLDIMDNVSTHGSVALNVESARSLRNYLNSLILDEL